MISQPGAPPSLRGSGAVVEPGPPRWIAIMELAHDRTLRVARALESVAEPTFDLRPSAESVARALGAEYAVFDERGDRLEAAQTAIRELEDAATTLSPNEAQEPIGIALSALREALNALRTALDPLSRLLVAPSSGQARDLVASVGAPTLHAPERPLLVPSVRVKAKLPTFEGEAPLPPIEKPKTQADLAKAVAELKRRKQQRDKEAAERREAKKKPPVAADPDAPEVPPGFVPKLPRPSTEDDFIGLKARELFEEVAMVGIQRTPLLGDPFRSTAFLERRLLCALDALVGYGFAAVRRVEPFVIESPAKDSSRAFGAAMIHGCIAGRDSLAAAERVLRYCGAGDPEVAKGWTAGMQLVPHTDTPMMLRTMMLDPDASYRAIALRVMVYREWATCEELVAALSDPDPEVFSQALVPLALMKWPGTADVLSRFAEHENLAVREAVWNAMVASAHLQTVSALEDGLDSERADAASALLGVIAESREAERLLAKMQDKPTEPMISAVGWAGSPAAVPALIAVLSARNVKKEQRIAAAYALDRITGARLWENVEIDPEQILVDEPEAPEVKLGGKEAQRPKPAPLATEVSDPRDLPSSGAPDVMMRPTTKAEAWKSWWREFGPKFTPSARYRRGRPYTPLVSLWEMNDGWVVTPYERRLLQKELIARTGEWVRFDPHDWIPVQEESLKQWEERARRASGAPGDWSRAMTRR